MSKNAVVVASAGNDGQTGNEIMYPAGFPGVVAVSGTDENHAFWTTSESGPDVTVAAPASQIASAGDNGQYVEADGTSYAAGYVSATLALIRSRYPTLTAGQAIRQLISTTRQHTAIPGPQLGYGEIDPLTSLTTSVDATSAVNPLLAPRPTASGPTGMGTAWLVALSFLAATILGLVGWIITRKAQNRISAGAPSPSPTAAPRLHGAKSRNPGQRPRPKSSARLR